MTSFNFPPTAATPSTPDLVFSPDHDLIMDPRFKYRNGNPVLNQFGATGTMSHAVSRTDEGWGMEAVNGVTYHGANHFDFSQIPARPDSQDGYACGVWAVSMGVSPQVRLHYGIDLLQLRQTQNWTMSFYYLILPNTHPAIDQNLTDPTSINLSDINLTAEPEKNFFGIRIMDATQSKVIFDGPDGYAVMQSGLTTGTTWQQLSYDFTIPSNNMDLLNRFGSERAKLEIWMGNKGHPRYLIYDVHLKPTA